jgi:hypothetical protein
MSRILPVQPSLEHLRKEAKALRKSHQGGDAAVCPTLRRLHRFAQAADADILAADVTLAEVQFALALDYGFASWPALKAHVTGHNRAAGVRRENGRVWVDGVPALAWGTDRECTFPGAMEAALAVTDAPMSYADLMGYSALAFRVRWYQGETGQRWCPSSCVGEFAEPIQAVGQVSGWTFRAYWPWGATAEEKAALAPEIVASVDAGRPVLVYDAGVNVAVAYGYEDGGSRLLVKQYGSDVCLPAGEIGPMVLLLAERQQPLPAREALRQGLTTAAHNWRTEREAHQHGCYLLGDAALRGWAHDLGHAMDDPNADRNLLFFVSWWCLDSLYDARGAAARFLAAHADDLGSEAAPALRRAADCYAREQRLLQRVFDERTAFLGPWSGKTIADWTDDVRAREQQFLHDVRTLDDAAITEMEGVLALTSA